MSNEEKIYNIMKEGLETANKSIWDLIKRVNAETQSQQETIDIKKIYDELYKIGSGIGSVCGSVEMYENGFYDKM